MTDPVLECRSVVREFSEGGSTLQVLRGVDLAVKPAERVAIIGAGPAGLECAYMAARRGHEVHVYDKRDVIGGTLNEAKNAPYGDDELWTCIEYQKVMCEQAGVNFSHVHGSRLPPSATAARPELEGRDVVLVDDGLATGATMLAAAQAVRTKSPASVVVAVPVGAQVQLGVQRVQQGLDAVARAARC